MPIRINLWALFVSCILVAGCDETSPPTCGSGEGAPCPRPAYAPPTAPESLITNLQVSYRNREIEHYAQLLAPEFKFAFQPIDANVIGTQYWTRDQDSTGTRALLTTNQVANIQINLTYSGRDTSINFPGTPLDSLRIRIITTDLQVDQTDGTTWVVADQQDMFFRKGKAGNGEDVTHWFLYEWDDLPSIASPGLPGAGTTWGMLKTLF